MNKLSTKITAICLCAAIVLGCAGVAYALTGEKNEVPAKAVTTSMKAEEEKEKKAQQEHEENLQAD